MTRWTDCTMTNCASAGRFDPLGAEGVTYTHAHSIAYSTCLSTIFNPQSPYPHMRRKSPVCTSG